MDNNNEITIVKKEPALPSDFKKIASSIFDIFEMFAVCTAVIMLLFSYVARLTVVDGGSMEDTLHNNDYLIVHSLGYTPEQGDVVVIQKTSSLYFPHPIIKRVIAVEGQTVDIDYSTWTVYVDGNPLDEPYANLEGYTFQPSPEDPRYLQFPLTVEEGKIFVMGDHRNHSSDSRVADIGQIDVRCVVGRAVLRILPFEKFGVVERAQYE